MARTTKKTPKKEKGCGNFNCLWCDNGEKHLYGLTPIDMRKRLLTMTQTEYLCRVYIPHEVSVCN